MGFVDRQRAVVGGDQVVAIAQCAGVNGVGVDRAALGRSGAQITAQAVAVDQTAAGACAICCHRIRERGVGLSVGLALVVGAHSHRARTDHEVSVGDNRRVVVGKRCPRHGQGRRVGAHIGASGHPGHCHIAGVIAQGIQGVGACKGATVVNITRNARRRSQCQIGLVNGVGAIDVAEAVVAGIAHTQHRVARRHTKAARLRYS